MIKNVQVLRAIAALLVVNVHLKDFLDIIRVPSVGSGGVDLFFVISGFVMVLTTQTKRPSAADFAKNRIARIVPI